MDLLTTLVLGSYVFSAGAYAFAWRIYKELSNHQRTELKNHLNGDCGSDCYFCED
jgi:hypothetical protein